MLTSWFAVLGQAPQVSAPAPSGGADFVSNLVTYGFAAPLLIFMWLQLRKREDDLRAKDEELKEERERVRATTERLLEQQQKLGPMMHQMTSTLKEAADALAGRGGGHDSKR